MSPNSYPVDLVMIDENRPAVAVEIDMTTPEQVFAGLRDGLVYVTRDHYMQRDNPRLPVDEIAELNRQFNVNLSGDDDEWFDDEYVSPDMHIVDADEFFDRFCA